MNNTIYFEKNRETWTFVNLSQSYFYSVPSDHTVFQAIRTQVIYIYNLHI